MIVSLVKSLGQKTTLVQILYPHWLNRFGQIEPKNTRIKVKFTIQRALDVFRLPKAMLFTGKRYVRNWNPFSAQCFYHSLRLVRGHHLVFQPLKENNRARKAFDEVNR